jgi:kynurenine formamidase
MIINFTFNNEKWKADLDRAIPIALLLHDKKPQTKCFYAEDLLFTPMISGDFIGDIRQGGSANAFTFHINPHGNGTHTECSGHIYDNQNKIAKALTKHHVVSQLITIDITDKKDIDLAELKTHILIDSIEALIIRTLPNGEFKKSHDYSGTNPVYIKPEVIEYFNQIGILHLLVDLPSIDPESDGGALLSHKAFWPNDDKGADSKTITELVYVPDEVVDGLYLLNIQTLHIDLDASPSQPVIYTMQKIKN